MTRHPELIVVIGAPAGGLVAFTEMISNLENGLEIVVAVTAFA